MHITRAFARCVAERGLTVAVAESVTGGGIALALVEVPGSSEWFKGALVAYDSEVKYAQLGVTRGPVICESAANEMAAGITRLLDADIGIATTGCSGPEPMEDQPVGTVWIGLTIHGVTHATHHCLEGDADAIRHEAIKVALAEATNMLLEAAATP